MTVITALTKPQPKQATQIARLSVIAADYSRYPGEATSLHIRIDARAGLTSIALNIDVPKQFEVIDVIAPSAMVDSAPAMQELRHSVVLTWQTRQAIAAGATWEFTLELRALPEPIDSETPVPVDIVCDIAVNTLTGAYRTSTVATIMLVPKARYVRHLPGIYRDDALMNQMLMMFESFWKPIESQITQIHTTFDPKLMPASLLPYFAAWADYELDDRWPEATKRALVANMVQLNRRRGTREGLAHLLKIFTGVTPDIIERRADNMVVGVAARLGYGIALGTANVPHTFAVRIKLPALPPAAEAERRRLLESLIAKEKPAHTQFTLEIIH
jgi:phage tail-like protein